MLGASDFAFIRCFWILQSFWLIQQFPYFAKWFCAPGVQPVRQRPCVDCFHGPMFFCFAKDSETMLWGLTGTPCLDDFANVAKLVRACSDIDLLVFRRQLDAKDLVTWKNVFGRFASGVLSHFRWVWEHLGNFCTSFDVICSEETVFCLLCATWSYNHFRRNELWTTWHVPMAIWRVWRHLNSRPFDRFDDVICVICVISKSYHARCKGCWFYQKKFPPQKRYKHRPNEMMKSYKNGIENEDKDEGPWGNLSWRSRRSSWPCTTLLQSVPFMKALRLHGEAHGPCLGKKCEKNCGQTVTPGKPWDSCLLLSDSMWLNCCNGFKIHIIYIYIYRYTCIVGLTACIYIIYDIWLTFKWELLRCYICFHTSSFSNDKRRVSSARMPRRARRMRLWAPNSCSSVSRHVKTGEVNALDLQFAHQNT